MATTNLVKRLKNIMRMDKGVDGDAQRIGQMVWLFFLKVYDAREEEWEYKTRKSATPYKSLIPEEYRWRNWAHAKDENGLTINTALTGEELIRFTDKMFGVLKTLPVTPKTPFRQALVREVFSDLSQFMKDGILLRQVIDVIDEIDFTDAADSHAFGDIYEEILRGLQSAGDYGEFYTPRALTDLIVFLLHPKLDEVFGDLSMGTGGFAVSRIKYNEKDLKSANDVTLLQKSIVGQEWKPFPYLLCITNLLLHGIDEPNVKNMDSLGRRVRDYKPDLDVVGMNPPYGGSTAPATQQNFPEEFRSSETADLFLVLIMQRLKPGGRAGVVIPDGFLFGTEGAKLAIKRKLLKEFNVHTILRLPGSVFAPYTPIATNVIFFDRPEDPPKEGTYATKETWFYRMDMPEGYKHFSKTKPMLFEHTEPIRQWWKKRVQIVGDEIGEKARRFKVQELLDTNCNFDLCKFPKDDEEILPPEELIAKFTRECAAEDKAIKELLVSLTSKMKGSK